MELKRCRKCNQEKIKSEFHRKNKNNTLNSWCKACVYELQKNRWRDRKRRAVMLMGGQCCRCGYNRNLAAFHFHHLDPRDKGSDWNKLRLHRWSRIVNEIKKCILLCANCHAEEHAPDHNLIITVKGDGVDNGYLNRVPIFKPTGVCLTCNKEVYGTKYCSSECSSVARRKVKRPRKTTLIKQLETMSWCKIGRKYGVSDNAVRKWARTYKIIPSRDVF